MLALVMAAALLPAAGSQVISRDEAATLYSAQLSAGGLWEQARVQDVALVPYYLLVRGWLELGSGLPWARTLSLLGYAAAVFFSARLASVWLSPVAGVASAVLTGLHPLLVQQATSARPYALTAGLAAAAAYALALALERDSARHRRLFGGCAAAACALQAFAGLATLGMLAAALLCWPHWAAGGRRRLLLAGLPTAVLMVLLLAAAVPQRAQLSYLTPLASRRAAELALAPLGRAPGSGLLQLLLVTVVAAMVLMALAGSRDPIWRGRAAFSGAWLALPAALLLLLSVLSPVYWDRYVTASAASAGALAVSLVGALRQHGGRRAATVVVFALAGALAVLRAQQSLHELSHPPSEGYAQAAPVCGHLARDAAVLALPNHMAATALLQYLPEPVPPLWPQVRQPYLEHFALADDSRLLRTAPPRIVICDFDGPFDRAGLARFERHVEAAGYGMRETRRIGAVVVRVFERTLSPLSP
jgi:mannosyltransferase